MHPVPHAEFLATFDATPDEPHPPGAALARRLEDGLRQQFEQIGERDIWRDCGWVIALRCGLFQVQVYFAPYKQEGSWLLAVAPLNQPGALARLFGRKPLPSASELERVSAAVHGILGELPQVQRVQWMLGGPPENVPHVSSPEALAWNAAR